MTKCEKSSLTLTILDTEKAPRIIQSMDKQYLRHQISLPCVEVTRSRSVKFYWLKWKFNVNKATLNRIFANNVRNDASINSDVEFISGQNKLEQVGSDKYFGMAHYLSRYALDRSRYYTCVVTNKNGYDYHSYYVTSRNDFSHRYIYFDNF